eukprot:m.174931 g.174931  ORF g.174931 m.174931 type:complete len:378 (-) comp16760_c0_seq9:920-2053(-)
MAATAAFCCNKAVMAPHTLLNQSSRYPWLRLQSYRQSCRMLSTATRVVMSGAQPTGNQHLGNYLGAIKQWVHQQNTAPEMQHTYFSVMDLHSITVPQDPSELNKNIFETIATFLACGIDPAKATIFQQSTVKQHSELAWLLSCFANSGDLQRMTQWKSKSHKQKVPTLGLYAYPVLMAADILLYNTTHVPVGEDQVQHLELTRDLASYINNRYNEAVLTVPDVVLVESCRVRSLRKPTEKMSKSDRAELSRIGLQDDPDTIASKIRRAVTDSTPGITFEPETRPGVANLLTIYATISQTTPEQAADEFAAQSMGQLKDAVTTAILDELRPIQARMATYQTERGYIANVLKEGQATASAVAETTIDRVKRVVGVAPLF